MNVRNANSDGYRGCDCCRNISSHVSKAGSSGANLCPTSQKHLWHFLQNDTSNQKQHHYQRNLPTHSSKEDLVAFGVAGLPVKLGLDLFRHFFRLASFKLAKVLYCVFFAIEIGLGLVIVGNTPFRGIESVIRYLIAGDASSIKHSDEVGRREKVDVVRGKNHSLSIPAQKAVAGEDALEDLVGRLVV